MKSQPISQSDSLLELESVGYTYTGSSKEIIDSINISINRGTSTAIVGPSGCGKSTLLKIIGGLVAPTRGKLRTSYTRGTIGYSPQSATLLPWLDLQENVSLLALLRKEKVSSEECEKLFAFVGLQGKENSRPDELSGGMQTRTSLARSFAGSPELVLMDEPFSSLDEITAEGIILDLPVFLQKERPTMLFVSHNIRQAVMLADDVLVVGGSPMRLVDRIKIDLPSPRSKDILETQEFIATVAKVRNSLRSVT